MNHHLCCALLSAALQLVLGSTCLADVFRMVAWNVESGGITRSKIGEQLRDFEGVHLWALSEVQAANADFFIASAAEGEEGEFSGAIGNTGGADRLLVIVDESMFEFLDAFEFEDLALGGRAPLVAHLKARESGTEFLFVVIHLHRRNANKRLLQAQGLRDWASQEALPIIAAGDFNFDFEVPDGPGNEAFDEFGLGDIFRWEQPSSFVATQYSDSDGNGENDHDSVLDFVWSAGAAQSWSFRSEIIIRSGDFPDDERTSDHRPVMSVVDTSAIRRLASSDGRTLRVATRRSASTTVPGSGVASSSPLRPRFVPLTSSSKTTSLAGTSAGFGRFEGRVAAEWETNGRDMTLLEDFHYVDSRDRRWSAPAGATVDGASIPRTFWSLIGGPFEGHYRNASVVHDVYCDTKDRPWRDVHRMFYEACRCGGAETLQSKLMYYAVYHFGPRWGDSPATMAPISTTPLDDADVRALRAYIEWHDPSLDQLETIPPALFTERHKRS